ncbi:hypothetical protein [Sphaerotilus sp.]|uniref:hypothetical protein n=1 Tax=Sphaerotilus sp. TaxID=2093942 RepID=UPI002ACE1E04|nr:hypothetical protein [Sphaerotilus sp.]MDZ7858000.1 hypothetical protein [Sphaerotilus sp.]
MNHTSAQSLLHPTRCSQPVRRLAFVLLAAVAFSTADVSAQGLQTTRSTEADTPPPSRSRAAPTTLRVISTRSHMQCPLPGKNSRVLSIDSPSEWEDTIEHQDERTALGRKVRWSKERVLVYALDAKPHAGIRLESPSRVIRISQGILYWPVRQVLPETRTEKATVLTRPCVMTTIDRAYWHRIRIVPTRP